MTPARSPLRLLRGGMAASLATAVALGGHLVAGAAMPTWLGVALPWWLAVTGLHGPGRHPLLAAADGGRGALQPGPVPRPVHGRHPGRPIAADGRPARIPPGPRPRPGQPSRRALRAHRPRGRARGGVRRARPAQPLRPAHAAVAPRGGARHHRAAAPGGVVPAGAVPVSSARSCGCCPGRRALSRSRRSSSPRRPLRCPRSPTCTMPSARCSRPSCAEALPWSWPPESRQPRRSHSRACSGRPFGRSRRAVPPHGAPRCSSLTRRAPSAPWSAPERTHHVPQHPPAHRPRTD